MQRARPERGQAWVQSWCAPQTPTDLSISRKALPASCFSLNFFPKGMSDTTMSTLADGHGSSGKESGNMGTDGRARGAPGASWDHL